MVDDFLMKLLVLLLTLSLQRIITCYRVSLMMWLNVVTVMTVEKFVEVSTGNSLKGADAVCIFS